MAKYREEIVRQIETAIQRGLSQIKTCDLVGITEETFYRWMKKDEFSKRIKKARAGKVMFLLENIRVAGIGELTVKCDKCGEEKIIQIPSKSWQALAWILERTECNDFAIKQKLEHTGKDGEPIELNTLVVIRSEPSGDNGNGKAKSV